MIGENSLKKEASISKNEEREIRFITVPHFSFEDKLPVSILIYTTRNQKLKFGKAKLLNDGNRFEFSALSSSVPNNLRAKETQHIEQILRLGFIAFRFNEPFCSDGYLNIKTYLQRLLYHI
ncbi:hypothetical protein Avbf_15135 [Armadillidium vulgare]|nr:hypothetical protein Avbf_15135 [Armadillidium vulgare]